MSLTLPSGPIVVNGVLAPVWQAFFSALTTLVNKGYSGTITTAALTGTGTEGSMTFQSGVLTGQTAAK